MPHLLINGWFWGQPATGSGQYLHGLLQHLPAALPDWQITLLLPDTMIGSPENRQFNHREHRGLTGLTISKRNVLSVPSVHSVVISEEPMIDEQRFNHQSSRSTIQYLPTPLPRLARGARLTKLAWEQHSFSRQCRRLGADVAFVPYWGSPLFPPCPTLVTIHDLIPILLPDYASKPTARAYTWLVARSARKAAAILTVSQSAGADIIRHLGIPGERVHVTYEAPGTPHAPITDPAELERIRATYDLPPAYLFYLGGFDPRKNVPLLIRAYAQALAARPDLPPLLIAGKLPEPGDDWFDDPRPLIADLGLGDRVRTLGFVPDADKPALYSLASLSLFPSRYEGFGLPPLEAMACGTPTLVSDSSSLPEVVGDTVAPVPVNDEAALAQAIVHTLDHPPAPEQVLAQAARFSWADTAAITAQIILHHVRQTAPDNSLHN